MHPILGIVTSHWRSKISKFYNVKLALFRMFAQKSSTSRNSPEKQVAQMHPNQPLSFVVRLYFKRSSCTLVTVVLKAQQSAAKLGGNSAEANHQHNTGSFAGPRTLRNEDSVTTSPKIAPAFVNSSAPQGLDQAKQQKQSAQHASTTKNTNPEVQELYTLQAELHRRLQHTDDPELRKQAQQVLHALNALQDTAQDPKTFAKEQKVGTLYQ